MRHIVPFMLELSHLRQFSEFSRNSRLHLTMASLWRLATCGHGLHRSSTVKLATTTFKALHTGRPPYLIDQLQYYHPTRSLRSSGSHQLVSLKNEMKRTAVFPIVGLPVCQLLSYIRIFHPNAAYSLACGWRPLWPVSCSCRSRALTRIIQAYSMLFSFLRR